MTDKAHKALVRIGVYMAQQVQALDEKDRVEVWSTIAMWCNGDIDSSDYEMDEDGEWRRKGDPIVTGD